MYETIIFCIDEIHQYFEEDGTDHRRFSVGLAIVTDTENDEACLYKEADIVNFCDYAEKYQF